MTRLDSWWARYLCGAESPALASDADLPQACPDCGATRHLVLHGPATTWRRQAGRPCPIHRYRTRQQLQIGATP